MIEQKTTKTARTENNTTKAEEPVNLNHNQLAVVKEGEITYNNITTVGLDE